MFRKPPEISAGSMADIAFLLLIFFLVSTTMSVDSGIMRKLPPIIHDGKPPIPVKKRNVLQVYLNSSDKLMVGSDEIPMQALQAMVKDFLTPRPEMHDNKRYAETKPLDLEYVGKVHQCRGVVSLTNDRGTSYKMYISVQNEVMAAINELREEFSQKHFGMSYADLQEMDKEKVPIVRKAVPVFVSEAEPVDFSN